MTLREYLANPCGTLSIPYWKHMRLTLPPQLRIVHQRDFVDADHAGYVDEPYFRLMHDLRSISREDSSYCCRTATEEDLPLLCELINRSYTDLSVTVKQLQGYRATPAFAADLWVIALDGMGTPVGCGIADFDPQAREGVLEWIQVLPEQRGRGVGQAIVNALLQRMKGAADFATVSGRVNNETNPERLYRKCGFKGNDVWHILTKK